MPTRHARREPTTGNGLRQLLDFEARLCRELAAARQEAEAIRKQGEEAAVSIRREGEATITAEEQALARQYEARLEEESRRIRDDLARSQSTLLSIPAERIDAIARDLLTRVVERSWETAS